MSEEKVFQRTPKRINMEVVDQQEVMQTHIHLGTELLGRKTERHLVSFI